MKEGPLTFENAVHERADRFGDCQHDSEKNQDLRDTNPGHLSTSKFLRAKEGVHQVNEKSRRHDSRDGIFHTSS
jgi:hypothetical protein